MSTASAAGRIVGVLILAQMIGGVLVNFVLTAQRFGSRGFLVNAAPHSPQIAVSVLLGLALGALSIGIAITAFPVFRQYTHSLSLWFVVLAAVSLATAAIEQINVVSKLFLSDAYTKANAAEREPFQALRIVVSSARNAWHYISLLMGGSTLLVLYTVLLRFALVPRLLAGFGLLAVLLQLVAVAMPLFGSDVLFICSRRWA